MLGIHSPKIGGVVFCHFNQLLKKKSFFLPKADQKQIIWTKKIIFSKLFTITEKRFSINLRGLGSKELINGQPVGWTVSAQPLKKVQNRFFDICFKFFASPLVKIKKNKNKSHATGMCHAFEGKKLIMGDFLTDLRLGLLELKSNSGPGQPEEPP